MGDDARDTQILVELSRIDQVALIHQLKPRYPSLVNLCNGFHFYCVLISTNYVHLDISHCPQDADLNSIGHEM